MSIFESAIYGFISGISNFFPISSDGHQILLRYLFGIDSRNFLQEFLVHIGVLCAVIIGCREYLIRLKREQSHMSFQRHKRVKKVASTAYYDLRLIKTALFPLFIGQIFLLITLKRDGNLLSVVTFMIVNAIILLLAEHTRHGNRDSATMTGLDGIVIGILGCFGVFPGLSGVGIVLSYATLRGADSKHFVNWAYILSIPAIILLVVFDVLGLITVGAGILSFSIILGYIFSGITAFLGGYLAISIFLTILNHSGVSQFAYYSIGVALLTFILYIIT